MLSKAVIFCFTFLGFFGLLMATMPVDMIPVTYSATYMEKEVEEVFDAADVLMFNNSLAIVLNYTDGPYSVGFGLPSGQYLEIDWVYGPYKTSSGIDAGEYIYFRHLVAGIFGFWYDYHDLKVYNSEGLLVDAENKIVKSDMIDGYDDEKNCTIFSLVDPFGHIKSNAVFMRHNESLTMEENWDAGQLDLFVSYDVDWSASGVSALTIMFQLLLFQAPNLGIGGVAGMILNAIVAIPTYACIAYLVYKLIAGIIPFISGGSGD